MGKKRGEQFTVTRGSIQKTFLEAGTCALNLRGRADVGREGSNGWERQEKQAQGERGVVHRESQATGDKTPHSVP